MTTEPATPSAPLVRAGSRPWREGDLYTDPLTREVAVVVEIDDGGLTLQYDDGSTHHLPEALL